MRIIRGFFAHEQVLIERALELSEAPIGLIIERAHLDAGVLGCSAVSIAGQPVVQLDLDQVGLPDDAIVYLCAHELAHHAGDHTEIYTLMERSKSLTIDERRAVQDLCEADADARVADWGLDWAMASWRRCFPEDRLNDPQWDAQARKRAEPVRRRLQGRVS